MSGHGQVPRHERLVDALSDDILGATDLDVLATQPAGVARVVADSLRQSLQRAIGDAAAAVARAGGAPRAYPVRRDREDEDRR